MIGWPPKLGPSRGKLASYSIAKYGPQTGNDSALDARRRQRHQQHQRQQAHHLEQPERRQFRHQLRCFNGLRAAPDQPVGHSPPTAACAITSWTTSTASGTRRTRTSIRSGRPCRKSATRFSTTPAWSSPMDPNALVRRPGGMGLDRLSLQRLRPAMVGPAQRLESGRLSRPRHQRRLGLHALAAQPVLSARHEYRISGCWIISRCIAIRRSGERRAAATSRPPPQLLRNQSTRQFWDTNYVDPSWINTHHHADPPHEELGRHLLSRHQNRHHRIQLGRRQLYQRRHRPGGHPRHFRPRGTGPGHALDHARCRHAHLQGDEDVPQLRRQQIHLRRHQRQCRRPESGQRLGFCRRALHRRRADAHGD